MGRPPVTAAELRAGGLSSRDLKHFSTPGFNADWGHSRLYPLAQAWPMGFSWSSFTAQETLLGIAADGGLNSEQVLAPDRDLVPDMSAAFALATDDLMFFSDSGPGASLELARRVEESMRKHGAVKHAEKDLDDSTSGVCIGVELVDGRQWWPQGSRLCELIDAVIDIAEHPRASPGAVGAFLGVLQWHDLLRRLKLSVFAEVYRFTGDATDWKVVDVPPAVLVELVVDIVLSAFTSVDMGLPYLGFLGATDASTEFGHGATIAPMDRQRLHNIAQLAAKSGEHVVLHGVDDTLATRRLLSRPHQLGLQLSDFEVMFSLRVEAPRHINLEEAEALLHFVRWVLRSPQRFCHRLVVLMDSRVVIGAVGKGRSGSVPLNRLLRRLAALTFAGELAVFVVFIPTAHNPADHPSRGGPASWPHALRAASRHGVGAGVRYERKLGRRLAHQALTPAGRLCRLAETLGMVGQSGRS